MSMFTDASRKHSRHQEVPCSCTLATHARQVTHNSEKEENVKATAKIAGERVCALARLSCTLGIKEKLH